MQISMRALFDNGMPGGSGAFQESKAIEGTTEGAAILQPAETNLDLTTASALRRAEKVANCLISSYPTWYVPQNWCAKKSRLETPFPRLLLRNICRQSGIEKPPISSEHYYEVILLTRMLESDSCTKALIKDFRVFLHEL